LPAEPSAAERQADAAALLRELLNELEPHGADGRAAEHSAAATEYSAKATKLQKPPPSAPAKPVPEQKKTSAKPVSEKVKPKHDHWGFVDEEE
jgi:hypothetical protein